MGKRWDRRYEGRSIGWQFGELIAIAGAVAAILFIEYLIKVQFSIRGEVLNWVKVASSLLVTVVVGWGAAVLLSRLAQLIISAKNYREPSVDAHLVRLCTRLVTFVIIVYLVVENAEVLGIPLTPVLAGLGVGGLAVALAARPTLENFIGGIILFVDKPVRVGDFCRFGDKIGTVEAIGLRSTRVRSLDRTLVTIPNAEFSQLQLENFAPRDRILFRPKLELRRATTEAQLRTVLAEVRDMLMADDRVSKSPCRVRLIGYGPSSVDLEIFTYVLNNDFEAFLAIREELLLQIAGIVEKAGTAYAMPVQINFSGGADPEPERAPTAKSTTRP